MQNIDLNVDIIHKTATNHETKRGVSIHHYCCLCENLAMCIDKTTIDHDTVVRQIICHLRREQIKDRKNIFPWQILDE